MSADYIEYLEQKKTEIVADHIRRCHDTKLSKAEEMLISQLNWQIAELKKMQGDEK
jgi:hypothetical protein